MFLILSILITLTVSCKVSSQDDKRIDLTKVNYQVMENSTIGIKLTDLKSDVHLTNPNSESTIIKLNNSEIKLNYLITELNLNNVFKTNVDNYGELLIFEYFILGASGKAANIVYTTILTINDNKIKELITYNSFFRGAESIQISNKSLVIEVFKPSINNTRNKEYYCKSNFNIYNNGKYSKHKEELCFNYTNAGEFVELINHYCDCTELDDPKVIN